MRLNLEKISRIVARLLASGEAWRYFIDGPDQARGRLGYAESNYIKAMMTTWSWVVRHADKSVSWDSLVELHTLCMTGVEGHHCTFDDEQKVVQRSMRTDFEMMFGLDRSNASDIGMLQLLQTIRDDAAVGYVVTRELHGSQLIYDHKHFNGYSNKALAGEAKSLLDSNVCTFETRNAHAYEGRITAALKRYEEAIALADKEPVKQRDQLKLRAIARVCQECARIHPFFDGNGRVFCMVLPYLLCLQQGMLIPLMRNVNHFAAFTLDELVAEMRQGFLNSYQLIRGEVPAGFADSYPEKVDETYAYFRQSIEAYRSLPCRCDIAKMPVKLQRKYWLSCLFVAIHDNDVIRARGLLRYVDDKALEMGIAHKTLFEHAARHCRTLSLAEDIAARTGEYCVMTSADPEFDSVLVDAIRHDDFKALKSGFAIGISSASGGNLLCVALQCSASRAVIKVLIDNHAQNSSFIASNNPLIMAAKKDDMKTVCLILKQRCRYFKPTQLMIDSEWNELCKFTSGVRAMALMMVYDHAPGARVKHTADLSEKVKEEVGALKSRFADDSDLVERSEAWLNSNARIVSQSPAGARECAGRVIVHAEEDGLEDLRASLLAKLGRSRV